MDVKQVPASMCLLWRCCRDENRWCGALVGMWKGRGNKKTCFTVLLMLLCLQGQTMNLIGWLVGWFLPSFIHSFIYSLGMWKGRGNKKTRFTVLLILLCIQGQTMNLFDWLICWLIHSFIPSLIHSLIHRVHFSTRSTRKKQKVLVNYAFLKWTTGDATHLKITCMRSATHLK